MRRQTAQNRRENGCAPTETKIRELSGRNPARNALSGVVSESCGLRRLGAGGSWAQTGDPPPSHRTGLRLRPERKFLRRDRPAKPGIDIAWARPSLCRFRFKKCPHRQPKFDHKDYRKRVGHSMVRHICADGLLSRPSPSLGCLKWRPMISVKSSRSTLALGSNE